MIDWKRANPAELPKDSMADQISATDYRGIAPDDAALLCGVLSFHQAGRAEWFRHYLEARGGEALADLFAQFVGLAASVVANSHEMISVERILSGEEHPDRHETQLNLPTLIGALAGVQMAHGIETISLCDGCAFRLGTPANQSPVTTADAEWCADGGGQHFYCHMDLGPDGKPMKACAGYARAAKRSAVEYETTNPKGK